ncbi:MAG: helix-turn-helix domain-containing protein [Chthonomonadales bacterium]|nr:helix-turn-helix domain-containing protein [Chthonomonadales bacterium]
MRLDEWQKWLDDQFLDVESEGPGRQAGESGARPGASPAAAGAGIVEPPPAEAAVAPAPPEAPPASAASADPPQGGDSVELPEIDQYLPFLRARMASAPAPAPVAPLDEAPSPEPAPLDEAPAAERPMLAASEPPAAAEPPVHAEPARAADDLLARNEPIATGGEAEPAAPDAAGAAAGGTPAVAARRTPARKARHARNVRPAEVVEEIDAATLWGLVPRHIQTLVAMGPDETAQRSYRRQFRESRLELLGRLLDPTLSLEDAARLLNVCPTTVRRYTNRGLLTHQRTSGDQRRFRLSDVLAFLEAQSAARSR